MADTNDKKEYLIEHFISEIVILHLFNCNCINSFKQYTDPH